jgi:hypothetical protein
MSGGCISEAFLRDWSRGESERHTRKAYSKELSAKPVYAKSAKPVRGIYTCKKYLSALKQNPVGRRDNKVSLWLSERLGSESGKRYFTWPWRLSKKPCHRSLCEISLWSLYVWETYQRRQKEMLNLIAKPGGETWQRSLSDKPDSEACQIDLTAKPVR